MVPLAPFDPPRTLIVSPPQISIGQSSPRGTVRRISRNEATPTAPGPTPQKEKRLVRIISGDSSKPTASSAPLVKVAMIVFGKVWIDLFGMNGLATYSL